MTFAEAFCPSTIFCNREFLPQAVVQMRAMRRRSWSLQGHEADESRRSSSVRLSPFSSVRAANCSEWIVPDLCRECRKHVPYHLAICHSSRMGNLREPGTSDKRHPGTGGDTRLP